MRLFTFLTVGFLLTALNFSALYAQDVTFIVTSSSDDANARDANPGDGTCADDNGRCTLRAAVDEANASDGQNVTIVLPGLLPGSNTGTYTLTRVAPNVNSNTYENDNAYGDLDLNGSFKSLALLGTGTPGPTITVSPNDRILDIVDGGMVTIERIHFNGGTARAGNDGNPDNSEDYGINGEDGANGGALRVGSGFNVRIDQCTFSGNFTQSGGNGVAPASSIELIDGGNGGSGGNGGAIYVAAQSKVDVYRSTFTGNGTGDGGSPASGQSNGEPAQGGRGGNGGNGGAIYADGSVTLYSCTIVANTCGDPSGGANGVNGGERGEAGEGGSGGGLALARFVDGAVQSQGKALLWNTILADNAAGDDNQNGPQPGIDFYDGNGGSRVESRGYNLIGQRNDPDAFRKASTDEIGAAGEPIDPLLNGLNQNSDAAVPTMMPQSGSPAINNGTTITSKDYDGRGFLRPSGGQADRGAYELNAEPVPVMVSISSFEVMGADKESITLTNKGDYPVQLDDHVLVIFPPDVNDSGTSCLSINLYGKLTTGEKFTIGDAAIDYAQQVLDLDVRGPSCQDDEGNDFNDEAGAIALYTGGATSLQGFVLGNYEAERIDMVTYGLSDQSSNSSSGEETKLLPLVTQLTASPNPVGDQLNITAVVRGGTTSQLQLIAPNGAILRTQTLMAEVDGPIRQTLDLSGLPTGLFILRLSNDRETISKRLVRR